jgi:VWFA-related protein
MTPSRLGIAGRVCLALLVASLGAGIAADGAEASRTANGSQAELRHETGITIKLIQVFVTGKDKKPVADLAAEEFEITDNGRPVPVYHLERHFAEVREKPGATPLPAARLSRKYFLLFDFAFVHPRGAVKAKEAAVHFLESLLLPADEVALLSYSGARGLTLHEYLTTDHAKVLAVVNGFGAGRAMGRAERVTDYFYAGASDVDAGRAADLPPEEQFFKRQVDLRAAWATDEIRRLAYIDQARQFILTLRNLAKSLRYVSGPKTVILFSGGIARQALFGRRGGFVLGEWSTPEELAEQLNEYDAAQADGGLQRDFSEALKECRAADCAVYAVEVSRVQSEVDVLYPAGSGEAAQDLAGADSLRQLSEQTGGRYYGNLTDARASMADIRDATGSYYILGFQIRETWDGAFHKIKVKVRRKGCEARTQGGYFNPKPFKSYSSFERLLHMTDLALNENPAFQVPAELRLTAVPVVVKGFSQLAAYTRLPGPLAAEVAGLKSEALLIVFDDKGAVVALKSFGFEKPKEDPDPLVVSFVVPLAPGRYSLRMVVRNRETGKGARGAAPAAVPRPASLPVWLDPPLLLRADPSARERGSAPDATLSALYTYDPAAYAPLDGAAASDLPDPLYAALRCDSSDAIGDLSLAVSLLELSSGDVAEIPFTIIGRSEDGAAKRYLLALKPGELKPGDYELRFGVRRAAGGVAFYAAAPLAVR